MNNLSNKNKLRFNYAKAKKQFVCLLASSVFLCSQHTMAQDVEQPDDGQQQTNQPTPQIIVDSNFYTEPANVGVWRNLVVDYGVDNTDALDDSALLQQAIDEISSEPNGGTLYIPDGDYYLLSVKMRSNVHLDIDEGVTIYPTWKGDGRNHRIFEAGFRKEPKVENVSIIGRGNGFTIDFRQSNDSKLAVFNMGNMQNFKISNLTIEDNKTIFASFLVGVTRRARNLYWPQDGIIEKVRQYNSLFGYGVIQTYAADNVLFRDLEGEGGVTLRMETDNLDMKKFNQGGIRDIYAENIHCNNGLAAVMLSPHFMDNGSVEVNGVESNGCGFTVRIEKGFVELFSPTNEVHTRESWQLAVETDIGVGCAGSTYARGNNGTRWATRINDVGNCLDITKQKHDLKPGTFAESAIFNVTANYGTNAHLKQDQLGYFDLSNPTCAQVCLPTTTQWPRRGQIYLGPSISAVKNLNVSGQQYNFDVNIHGITTNGFPASYYQTIDSTTSQTPPANICNLYGMTSCPDSRWD